MEWLWVLPTGAVLFSYYVVHRLAYVKGFKSGARKILGDWKRFNEEDETDER